MIVRIVLTAGLMLAANTAAAHAPIMVCYDNGDATVTCEAGFSDGASATGATVSIMTPDQRLLDQGQVSDRGEFSFARPADPDIEIHFVPDSTHALVVYGDEIVPFEE